MDEKTYEIIASYHVPLPPIGEEDAATSLNHPGKVPHEHMYALNYGKQNAERKCIEVKHAINHNTQRKPTAFIHACIHLTCSSIFINRK